MLALSIGSFLISGYEFVQYDGLSFSAWHQVIFLNNQPSGSSWHKSGVLMDSLIMLCPFEVLCSYNIACNLH